MKASDSRSRSAPILAGAETYKWSLILTVKITSEQFAPTTTAKVVNVQFSLGTALNRMTLQEAQQYYNQP